MCTPASFMIPRTGAALWSRSSESHAKIIEEHGLHVDGCRGANCVAAEISPPNADYKLPLEQWVYRIDDGFPVPDWYDAADVERRVRDALPDWIAAKLVLPGHVRQRVADGCHVVAVYGSVGEVYDSGRVGTVYGSGSVGTVYGSGSVGTVYGSGRVERVYDSGRVERVYDSGSVGEVYGSGRVERVYGSGSVGTVYGSGRVERVYDSGRVGTVYGSGRVGTVYGSGSVGTVYGSGRVERVYDSGRVERVYDSGRVERVYDSGSVGEARDYSLIQTHVPLKVKLVGPHAVLIDRSGEVPKMRRGRRDER